MSSYSCLWNSFERNSDSEPVYPDNYGGAYIDRGLLHVYLTENTNAAQSHYVNICAGNSAIIFVQAQYSLNYLESLRETARKYIDEYNTSGFGVDEKANRFVIFVAPPKSASEYASTTSSKSYDTDTTIKELNNLINNPAVKFEVMDYPETCTNLYGGDTLNGDFTLGICGTYNGNPAILTAGHCVANPNGNGNLAISDITYGKTTTTFANVQECEYKNGGLGDYAIATISSGSMSTTNKVHISSNTYESIKGTAYSGATPAGTTIYSYGKTSGYATSTVYQTNLTVIYENKTYGYEVEVNGLVKCLVTTGSIAAGDSGWPTYIKDSGTNKLVGVISGRVITNYSYMIYSPIYYAEYAGFNVKTS